MNPVMSDGLALRQVQENDRLHLQLLCCEHLKTAGSVPPPDILRLMVDEFAPRGAPPILGKGGGPAARKSKQAGERVPWLAVSDGTPIAAAVVEVNPDHLNLRRLLVRPAYRRMGVGSYIAYRLAVLPLIQQERRRRNEAPRYYDAHSFVDALDLPSNDMLRRLGFRAKAFLRNRQYGCDVVAMSLPRDRAGRVGAMLFGPGSQWCPTFPAFTEALRNLSSMTGDRET